MEKILILGATGRIVGLAADIIYNANPASLRVATSREAGLASLRDRYPGAEVVQADWYDPASLGPAMAGVSRVLVVTPDWVTDESVVTPNIIAAAKMAGSIRLLVRMLANPPGGTVDDVPPEFLATGVGAAHHLVAKPLLDASGLPICYVNVPAWFMSNLAWFAAAEVKAKRQIGFPAALDADRMWVSEHDIAAVMARTLMEPVARHVGKEYFLTSERYRFTDIARTFSEQLGEPVAYVDDGSTMRETFGEEGYNKLLVYMRTEGWLYGAVPHRETIAELLGRPQQTLGGYIGANLEDYR